jgi:uncharacterized protein (TIGR02145 family)
MKKIIITWFSPFVLIGLILFISSSCSNDDNKQIPTLTTKPVININQNIASTGGKISSDGGSPIIARGVCWSINQLPTISDYKTIDTSSTDSFTSSITGLNELTNYYVRAYATNSVGTGYGNIFSFKTTQIITDIDGNTYHSVTIGSQVWLLENLKTTKCNDGTIIPEVKREPTWDSMISQAYCSYNNNKTSKDTWGLLYNWYAVNTAKLCPDGWHVPSDSDWIILTNYLGGDNIAGGKLKQKGTAYWKSPNLGATNESGFTALPAGYRYEMGTFGYLGSNAVFWSSSFISGAGSFRDLNFGSSKIRSNISNPNIGYSVRCIKN